MNGTTFSILIIKKKTNLILLVDILPPYLNQYTQYKYFIGTNTITITGKGLIHNRSFIFFFYTLV